MDVFITTDVTRWLEGTGFEFLQAPDGRACGGLQKSFLRQRRGRARSGRFTFCTRREVLEAAVDR